jgi:hypothetical protein
MIARDARRAALLLSVCACNGSHERAPPPQRRAPAIFVSATPTTAGQLRPSVDLTCRKLVAGSCDVREQRCQEQRFDLAQCLTGRDGERPPLRLISEAVAREKRREHRAQESPASAELERAVHALGLGKLPEAAAPAHESNRSGTNAFYSPRERSIFFVADDPPAYAAEQAALTLVHEYVHAIQDRTGELLRAQTAATTRSFEWELTQWSTFEGEATLYQEVVRAFLHERDPKTWIVERFTTATNGSDSSIIRQGRPLEASFSTFPYSYGAYWATFETSPPSSTQQLLAKRHGWPVRNARDCDDRSPARLGPQQPRRATDTLGAWLMQAYVRRRSGDAERARSAARRWRGDWLSLYLRAPGQAASFIWQTCWDSAATALEMRELIAEQLRESAGPRASVISDAERVTATIGSADPAELAARR